MSPSLPLVPSFPALFPRMPVPQALAGIHLSRLAILVCQQAEPSKASPHPPLATPFILSAFPLTSIKLLLVFATIAIKLVTDARYFLVLRDGLIQKLWVRSSGMPISGKGLGWSMVLRSVWICLIRSLLESICR